MPAQDASIVNAQTQGPAKKWRIVVLSAFDGIGCITQAMRAFLNVGALTFAVEVDETATQVTRQQHPNTVNLGDVREISDRQLEGISRLVHKDGVALPLHNGVALSGQHWSARC